MSNINDGQLFTTIMDGKEVKYLYYGGQMILIEDTKEVRLTDSELKLIVEWHGNSYSMGRASESKHSQLVNKLKAMLS